MITTADRAADGQLPGGECRHAPGELGRAAAALGSRPASSSAPCLQPAHNAHATRVNKLSTARPLRERAPQPLDGGASPGPRESAGGGRTKVQVVRLRGDVTELREPGDQLRRRVAGVALEEERLALGLDPHDLPRVRQRRRRLHRRPCRRTRRVAAVSFQALIVPLSLLALRTPLRTRELAGRRASGAGGAGAHPRAPPARETIARGWRAERREVLRCSLQLTGAHVRVRDLHRPGGRRGRRGRLLGRGLLRHRPNRSAVLPDDAGHPDSKQKERSGAIAIVELSAFSTMHPTAEKRAMDMAPPKTVSVGLVQRRRR